MATVYVTDLEFCGSPTQDALNWRGGALVQLGPTPTEPLGTQNFAKSCASLIVNLFTLYPYPSALKCVMSSARHCRSLHTQLRRPAHHATALPASCHGSASLGRCAHGPWLALAGWLLSNTVSLDISFSSREHVTRCSLGRATRWACSIGFSGHTTRSDSLPAGWWTFSTRVGGHARADLPPPAGCGQHLGLSPSNPSRVIVRRAVSPLNPRWCPRESCWPPFLSWPPVRGRCGLCCGESRVGRAVVVTATHARSGRLPRGFTMTGGTLKSGARDGGGLWRARGPGGCRRGVRRVVAKCELVRRLCDAGGG